MGAAPVTKKKVIDRRGVAKAVLQTTLLLIH